ncbi:MAG TPA: NYN domain-containing protein [Candidatus Moranbacteria bacterium]|nr:NYN domain-containing protein [Candidatus Moranbacteria bacterium]
MSIFKEQRVGVLVDIQNLYYSAKVLYGKKVNFGAVLKEAVGDRKLIRAIAYGISTIEKQEGKFFEALAKQGFEVKTKDLQVFPGGAKKGDWDVGITVDAIKLSRSLDVIVLVSGDGDYLSLVEYLQSTTGCRVEGIAFLESTSGKLVEELDQFTNISENKKKFLI